MDLLIGQMKEAMVAKLSFLFDLNLTLRYPEELTFRLLENGKYGISADNMLDFSKNHKCEVLRAEVPHQYPPVCDTICMVDGKRLFEIKSKTSKDPSYPSCIYSVELVVNALDDKPVEHTYEGFQENLKMMKEEELKSNRSFQTAIIQNLKTLAFSYPWEVQKTQLVEEIGELLQAVSKYERANGIGQPTSITPEDAMANLIEEIAGVQVMMYEIMEILNIKSQVKAEMMRQTDKSLESLKEKPSENNDTR